MQPARSSSGRGRLVALATGFATLIVWLCVLGAAPALAQTSSPRTATGASHRASAHAARKRHHHRRKHRHFKRCTSHTAKFTVCDTANQTLTMKGGAQDTVQRLLIGFAKDQLKGFILNQFGVNEMTDPVGTKLNQITSQLTGITSQLTTVQTSINNTYKLVVAGDFHTALDPLVTYAGQVFSLYEDKFAPAIRGEIAYAEANRAAVLAKSTCNEVETCVDARNDFLGTATSPGYRQEFLTAQAGEKYIDLNATIHDYLVQTGARPSIVTLYGAYLVANSTGFLTRVTSDQLLSLYSYFADAEALATWMKAEYRAVDWGPDADGHVTAGHADEFRRFLARTVTGDPGATPPVESYFDQELAALPPLIPANAVISMSPNAAERTTTNDRPMWLYDPQYLGINKAWLPSKVALHDGRVEFEDTTDLSVGHALKQLNDAQPGGLSDWSIPTKDEWKGLLAGWQSTQNIRTFLSNMYPTDNYWHSLLPALLFAGGDRLWSRTATTADSKCLPGGTFLHLQVPLALSASGPVTGYDSAFQSMGPGPELYGSGATACYDNAWSILNGQITGRPVPTALLIVRHSTGTHNYMAEGAG